MPRRYVRNRKFLTNHQGWTYPGEFDPFKAATEIISLTRNGIGLRHIFNIPVHLLPRVFDASYFSQPHYIRVDGHNYRSTLLAGVPLECLYFARLLEKLRHRQEIHSYSFHTIRHYNWERISDHVGEHDLFEIPNTGDPDLLCDGGLFSQAICKIPTAHSGPRSDALYARNDLGHLEVNILRSILTNNTHEMSNTQIRVWNDRTRRAVDYMLNWHGLFGDDAVAQIREARESINSYFEAVDYTPTTRTARFIGNED